jgi:hypothetical protein
LGVIYKNDRPAMETLLPQIGEEPLTNRKIDQAGRAELIGEFK